MNHKKSVRQSKKIKKEKKKELEKIWGARKAKTRRFSGNFQSFLITMASLIRETSTLSPPFRCSRSAICTGIVMRYRK